MFNWLDREAAASGYINCTRIARGGFGPGGLSNRGSTVGGGGRGRGWPVEKAACIEC